MKRFVKQAVQIIENYFSGSLAQTLRSNLVDLKPYLNIMHDSYFWIYSKTLKNHYQYFIHKEESERRLEIGSGNDRIEGFETLDIKGGVNIDYLYDTRKELPFSDNTFQLIYASHVLEHIPWYQTKPVLEEWVRILKPGGTLEVWVPDGLKICRQIITAENNEKTEIEKDGWYKFNPDKDPYTWVNGRIFTYGDGQGTLDHPNWHRAIFTPNYLEELFQEVNLTNIKQLNREDVRGHDHGWINLGVKGTKSEL